MPPAPPPASFTRQSYSRQKPGPQLTWPSLLRYLGPAVGQMTFKLDCEGCEYDVLKSSRRIKDIDIIVAEFHINSHLRREGHSFENLKEFLRTQNPNIIIQSVDINMHEAR